MSTSFKRLALGIALSTCASNAAAQGVWCDSVSTVVAPLLAPPPIGDVRWLYVYELPACGQVGASHAARLFRSTEVAGDSQPSLLLLRRVLRGWRDRSLYAEAVRIAESAGAPEYLRVAAFDLLSGHVVDRSIGFGSMLERPLTSACAPTIGYSTPAPIGAPLTDPEALALAALARRVRDDGATPARVRRAAACLTMDLRPRTDRLEPVPTGVIQLTYICGNTFRVRSTWTREARLDYDVYGTPERGWVVAAPGHDEFFATERRGTVRLLDKGRVLQTKANGNKPC
jgi:hypothetical protein